MVKDVFHSSLENDRYKFRRLNPPGEDMYLRPDGTIKKDVDKIILFQRWWLDRLYRCPDGIFYKKILLKNKDGLTHS